jgi:hypothetical protein
MLFVWYNDANNNIQGNIMKTSDEFGSPAFFKKHSHIISSNFSSQFPNTPTTRYLMYLLGDSGISKSKCIEVTFIAKQQPQSLSMLLLSKVPI